MTFLFLAIFFTLTVLHDHYVFFAFTHFLRLYDTFVIKTTHVNTIINIKSKLYLYIKNTFVLFDSVLLVLTASQNIKCGIFLDLKVLNLEKIKHRENSVFGYTAQIAG